MTEQSSPDRPLAPVRRTKPVRSATAPDVDDADIARGQAAAVLGALGRLQLRVDVLAREQAEALAEIREVLTHIDERVTAMGARHAEPPRSRDI